MAFKEMKGGDTISLKDRGIGKPIEGVYIGVKTITKQEGKIQKIWEFRDEDDKHFAIWGFSNLDYLMEKVTPETLCRITYLGKSKIKNKHGNFSNLAKVETDEEGSKSEGEYVPE